MAYVPLDRFLFRAPLLPVRALRPPRGRQRDLFGHPLGGAALALASPDLAAAAVGQRLDDRVTTALDRYRRRAAFRPTPHGLWAGVGVGRLAAGTEVDTGHPAGAFRPTWKRLADLGRSLLDDTTVRARVRLRRAPSLIAGAHTVLWLGPGEGGLLEEKRAELDELLATVLEATASWTDWSLVRAAVAGDDQPEHSRGAVSDPAEGDGDGDGDSDSDEVDELLLTMIDDRLLHFDLVPPLVGPPAVEWMCDRLATAAAGAASETTAAALAKLNDARVASRAGDLPGLERALAALPGAEPPASGVDATLIFPGASARVTLSRAAVARAAALAPLLFRLQAALAPPAAERTPAAPLADALDATTEIFGAGALDLAAFGLGDYGVAAADESGDEAGAGVSTPTLPPPRALMTVIVDAIVAAARRGSPELRFRADELDPLLESTILPPTCELFLTPTRGRAGGARGRKTGDVADRGDPKHDGNAGENWLVGLHAPAGATWGRFASALGDNATGLFAALRTAEQTARPGEDRLDVSFAPSDALGDICSHPPLRAAALALTSWPAADVATVTVSDLELCADPAALEPLALRTTCPLPSRGSPGRRPVVGGQVAPAALHRVRSTMAPQGIWRLLAGWSLYRQHAPWAVTLGPLAELAWTPRLLIDGFVVAPASWKLPGELSARAPAPAVAGDDPSSRGGAARGRAVRAWRKAAGLPRFVQVGSEDELLPVDLEAPGAAADLVGQERVFEIWPPLGDTPDGAGRRVEVVIALADVPAAPARAEIEAATSATRSAGSVPPPRRMAGASSAGGWQTFKLFGAADRQDAVLLGLVAPLVAEARAAGELEGWFFLRYVDGPGRRPHLRLRVELTANKRSASGERFHRRLTDHLAAALAAGDVVTMERAGYFPESARFGGPSVMGAVHELFEADSELTCALLTAEARSADEPHQHDGGQQDEQQQDGQQQDGQADSDAGQEDPSVGRLVAMIACFDALARGVGLDSAGRRELAHRRREAHGPEIDQDTAREYGRAFRTAGRHLRTVLAKGLGGTPGRAVRAYELRVRSAVKGMSVPERQQLLPPLLHLSAVRFMGPDRAAELRAYDFWARTLDSLDRHKPR